MKRIIIGLALSAVLVLAVAAPAFAATGRDFGQDHIAVHAVDHGGFTSADNPGVHHQGFANWPGE